MLSKEQRKEAINKFKERKPVLGVFAVRCTASGRVWVGASRNLDASKNSTWFGLRHSGHQDKGLQAEWDAFGEDAFRYEVLERLDDDVPALLVWDVLKERKQRWMTRLNAPGLL